MRKREKVNHRVKHRVDYRHRWPTQQTLVESRESVQTARPKWRWESGMGRLRRLNGRSSPKPGKSTHPYDTGVGEQRSDSESSSGSTSEAQGGGRRCWKLFNRAPPAPPSPPPVPKHLHVKEETRPETPKTPVQYLRFLAGPRKSPFPRSRTATPSDFDKATVKSGKPRAQTPAPLPTPLPPKKGPPIVESPKPPPDRAKSSLNGIFGRQSLAWACS